jgi:periplasmic divalent cation tolerance protein
VQQDSENLLLIKTLEAKFEELEQFIKANHSYEIPEIVAISAEKVSGNYLNWIMESLD